MIARKNSPKTAARAIRSGGSRLALAAALLGPWLLVSPAAALEFPHWTTGHSSIELAAEQASDNLPFVANYRTEAVEQDLEFSSLTPVSFEGTKLGEGREDSEPRALDLFGEAAIPVSHLAIEGRWRSIAPVSSKELFSDRCTGEEELCDSPLMHAWFRLKKSLETASRLDKIRRVNTEVNAAVMYRTDTDNYGAPDYWASPKELAMRWSGDCKEAALAKMWMLAALDIPLSSMRIVVLRDLRRGLGHAVLVASIGETNFVLDNVTSELRRDETISWYQPLYAVSTSGSWIYGVRRPKLIANSGSPARS